MKHVQLYDGKNGGPYAIKPVQQKSTLKDGIQITNESGAPLAVTFRPTHPFSFPESLLYIPGDGRVTFQVAREIHFPYTVSKHNTRPRSRTAIMTVVQPQDDCKKKPRTDGSLAVEPQDPVKRQFSIKISSDKEALKIQPSAAELHCDQAVTFINQLKFPVMLTFAPATPFGTQDPTMPIEKGEGKALVVTETLRFPYQVSLDVAEPALAPASALLLLKH